MSVLDYTPKPWEPLWRVAGTPEEEEKQRKLYAAHGENPPPDDEIWVNEEYQAHVRYLSERGKAGVLHLSIKRHDKKPARDWRELQSIKNEVAGWEREALELFPAESRLVDQADQTHLWVLPAGDPIGIGFTEREVRTDVERREELARIIGDDSAGSQREWRPGLSTGPNYTPGG